MITNEELKAIKARAEAATSGPWQAIVSEDHGRPTAFGWVAAAPGEVMGEASAPGLLIDASFIAHARTDVPTLVEEVERLHTKLETALGTLADIAFMTSVEVAQEMPQRKALRIYELLQQR